jgi:hypothetical protein
MGIGVGTGTITPILKYLQDCWVSPSFVWIQGLKPGSAGSRRREELANNQRCVKVELVAFGRSKFSVMEAFSMC